MKRLSLLFAAVLVCVLAAHTCVADTSGDILKRVRAAEASVSDIRADMVIVKANKANVSQIGNGYSEILMLEKATVYYKRPDKIRYDGAARNIKATYVQNGYGKLVMAAMIRTTDNLKHKPGKMQDTLDLGFLSSWLWTNNEVSVVSSGRGGVIELRFHPRFGDKDKRCDLVWVDAKSLKVLRREKRDPGGNLKYKYSYGNFVTLGGKLPIATESKMYAAGGFLGTVNYRNVKANTGLRDSLFSLSQR